MKKTTKFGVLALLLIGMVVTTGLVYAFGGGLDSESKEEIRQAIEAGDYDAWKEAVSAKLTEENFNKLVERHQAMSEKREMMQEHRQAIEAALEAEDYEAWKAAMDGLERGPKIDEVITEENFDTFVQLHEARKSGDFETVQELSEELELEKGFGPRKGLGCGRFKNRIPLE